MELPSCLTCAAAIFWNMLSGTASLLMNGTQEWEESPSASLSAVPGHAIVWFVRIVQFAAPSLYSSSGYNKVFLQSLDPGGGCPESRDYCSNPKLCQRHHHLQTRC